MFQRSGPGRPCRGREWWEHGAGRPLHPDHPLQTPAGSSGARSAVRACSPSKAASWPIGARIDLISRKLSQNGVVSPKYLEKACHSPYVQNGSRKSPLEFLRFPFSRAFSHKELMVPF